MNAKQAFIEFVQERELSERELHERFNELLDEIYDFSSLGGYFQYMNPSKVLKTCDPIAYREEFLCWLNGNETIFSLDEVYYEGEKDEVFSEFEDYYKNSKFETYSETCEELSKLRKEIY